MQRPETNDDRRSIDGMVERAVGVLTTSQVGDGRVGQRHEPADLGTVEQDHMQHSKRHDSHFKVDAFWQAQSLQSCTSVRNILIIATKSEHQTSCGVEDGLEASLEARL